jgi:hypothetical protein
MPIFLSWVIDPDCNLDYHYEPSEESFAYAKEVEEFFNEKDEATGLYLNRRYLIYPELDEFGRIKQHKFKAENFIGDSLLKTHMERAVERGIDGGFDNNFKPLEDNPKQLKPNFNIYKDGIYRLTKTQLNWLSAKLVELSDYMNQEYPYSPASAFNLPLHGTFFKSQFALLTREKWRTQAQAYDPVYPIYVSFDIGAKDYTILYFMQVKPVKWQDGVVRDTPVLLFEYESNDTLGAEHFAEVIYKAKCPLTKKEFFPNYKAIILPHDGFAHDWTTGRTPAEILASFGLPVVALPEKLDFANSIQVARDFINIAVFANVPNCLIGIQNYRRRYDRQLQTYLDKDVHDINSDRAASLRYLAQYAFFDAKLQPRNFAQLQRR